MYIYIYTYIHTYIHTHTGRVIFDYFEEVNKIHSTKPFILHQTKGSIMETNFAFLRILKNI